MATTRKRPLTPEEKEDARRLREAWERYKHLNKGATQEWLSRETKIGKQAAINHYLNATVQMNLKALLAFCKAIKVKPEEISPTLAATIPASLKSEGGNIEAGPSIRLDREYPLISWIQAGEWTELCDNFQPGSAENFLPCHKNLGPCGYILRVKGNSMTSAPGSPYTFPEGFLLYVNPDAESLPGKFVIVRRNKSLEATFKRYVMVDGEPYLEALNPDWPNRYLKLEEGDQFCGVVVHAGYDNMP